MLYYSSDNSTTLRSSHGGQSETAKFICKVYDTVDASYGRISFRAFLQGFCGPHSESDRETAPSLFPVGTETEGNKKERSMKKLMMLGVALACAIPLTGCGKESQNTKVNPTSKNVQTPRDKTSVKTAKKAPPPRKKVSDKEAAQLLLAQNRDMMELIGMPKSQVDNAMYKLEVGVRENESNLPGVIGDLKTMLSYRGLQPCISDDGELIHVKTPYEKVVIEYAKSRHLVDMTGTGIPELVFNFRAMSEDDQKEAADKLAKLMK